MSRRSRHRFGRRLGRIGRSTSGGRLRNCARSCQEHSPHMRSFTVGFTDQADLSERDPATETAKLFGLQHTNIDITGPQAEATVQDWLAALDQPSLDGLNVYLISRAVRKEGIVVA